MTHSKSTLGSWRIAAALIAVAGMVGSVEAQQGRSRGGGQESRGPRPSVQPRQQQAPRQQPAAQPRQQQAPRQQQPAAQPRPQNNPQPRPAASQPQSAPRPAATPRPAAQTPSPVASKPAPRPAAPAPAPAPVASKPAPRPAAPAPAPTPVVSKPAPRPAAPAPTPPPVASKPAPRPATPAPAPKAEKPAPKATPPAVIVKRPEPSKPAKPGNGLNKPLPTSPAPRPPVVVSPPVAKPTAPKGSNSGPIVKKPTGPKASSPTVIPPKVLVPGNGLVKPGVVVQAPQKPRPAAEIAPRPDRQPRSASGGANIRRTGGLVGGAAAVAPATVAFNDGPTFDSGLVRSNGLVRPLHHEPVYETGHGGSYVVNGYGHDDYAWRTSTYVSYSSGYCAPAPCYPRWPYYSSPFYGSPLRCATIYTSYDPFCSSRYYVPCPPTYTYCGPTYYNYCPPTYCAPSYYDDNWSLSFGFSGSSSWFGFGFSSGYSYPSYSYPTYDCYDPCYRPYRDYNRCAPGYGWWRRPVWGWSTYNCDPWSCAEPTGPVSPFPPYESTGAFGLTQAAAIDPAQELEDAVYSTMRGNYQTAIDATRQAVLGAPESFAPGESELDKYQLQRATWALTVYENPPRAAVEDKDAAFMVAAIAALSGDHDRAREAASAARELGDSHPATLELLQRLAMDEARADWGTQSTMR